MILKKISGFQNIRISYQIFKQFAHHGFKKGADILH